MVDEAYRLFAADPDAHLDRLETARLRIPYPWIPEIRCTGKSRGHSNSLEMAPHLHLFLQPVRDSNPCLHLERLVESLQGDTS
jgi:hypothetical protein